MIDRIGVMLVVFLVVVGCTEQLTCGKPYIKVGNSCCLDKNDNSICDNDEGQKGDSIDVDKVAKKGTDNIVDEITQKEVDKITAEQTKKITDDITKQKTKEITDKILGSMGATVTGGTAAKKCDPNIPTKRQFDSEPYYTGSLIDAHVHMPSAFPIPDSFAKQAEVEMPAFDQDVNRADVICLFDREGIKSVVGFYLVANLLTEQSVDTAEEMEKEYPGRIAPFLISPHASSIDLKPEDVESIIVSNKGLFKGIGEIGMYKPAYKDMQPDDPKFTKLYDIADKYDLVVMIHPDSDNKEAIKKILKDYPDINFLFHGPESAPWLGEIFDNYPNAYYTLDTDLFQLDKEYGPTGIYGIESKEEFISFVENNYDKLLERNIKNWKEVVEKYPDRFTWGTDIAEEWQYDPEVGALLEEGSRAFIGQLDPKVQEKFAYKNAERLLTK